MIEDVESVMVFLRDVAEKVLRAGESLGLDGIEVYASGGLDVGCEIENGSIKKAEKSFNWGFGVRVLKEGGVGFAYATRKKDTERCVREAMRLSRINPLEGYSLPPEPGRLPDVKGVFSGDVAAMDVEDLVPMALDTVRGVESTGSTALEGGVGTSFWAYVLLSSAGVDVSFAGTEIGGGVFSTHKNGDVSTGFHYESSCTVTPDFFEVGKKAGEMAVMGTRRVRGEKGVVPVALGPDALSSLLGIIFSPSLVGKKALRGETYYSNRVGEVVAWDGLNVYDDPLLPGGLNTSPTDDEGVPSRKTPLIERGVLRGYLFDTEDAHRFPTMPDGERIGSTSNGLRGGYSSPPSTSPRNIVFNPTETSPPSPLEKGRKESGSGLETLYVPEGMDHGYLVPEIMGAHTANSTSGDFSVNAPVAFVVRDGRVVGAEKGVVLAGNLFSSLQKEMLAGVDWRLVGGSFSTTCFYLPTVVAGGMRVL